MTSISDQFPADAHASGQAHATVVMELVWISVGGMGSGGCRGWTMVLTRQQRQSGHNYSEEPQDWSASKCFDQQESVTVIMGSLGMR